MSDDNIDDAAMSDNNTSDAILGNDNTENSHQVRLVPKMYPHLYCMVEKQQIQVKSKLQKRIDLLGLSL